VCKPVCIIWLIYYGNQGQQDNMRPDVINITTKLRPPVFKDMRILLVIINKDMLYVYNEQQHTICTTFPVI
jgi:hypothetical protein